MGLEEEKGVVSTSLSVSDSSCVDCSSGESCVHDVLLVYRDVKRRKDLRRLP